MKPYLTCCIICLTAISGCHPPPVSFFSTDGYIRPYEQQFDEKLTIVFDQGVEDVFRVEGSGIKRMDVKHFRQSLKMSLYYTFVDSFHEINFTDQIDSTGVSIVLYRVRPSWEVISSNVSSVYVEDFGTTSTTSNVGALIRYDGIVYKNGVKSLILDNVAMSELTTYAARELPEVFKDGVKVLCEDIYEAVATSSPYGFQIEK